MSLKRYAELVGKIASTPVSERADLVKEKKAVSQSLQDNAKKAKNSQAARRELKFTMDEINNG
jgi:hypothetical protein